MKKNNLLEKPVFPYLVTVALCIACMLVIDGTQSNIGLVYILFALVAALVVLLCVLAIKKMLTDRRFFAILLAGTFLLRLAYDVYSIYWKRQHDVNTVYHTDGHAGYILWLVGNDFRLPDVDPITIYQFYHPPLWHAVCAFIVKALFVFGQSLERTFESLQFFTLFLTMSCSLIGIQILRELKLKGFALRIAGAIWILHPSFIFMSGFLNNDIMAVFFMLGAVLFTVRWYRDPTLKRILAIAVCIGLGMMTKLSAALVAPPIALVFLIKAASMIREKKLLRTAGQFAGFAAVCVPLGLWFSVRNLLLYNVPIGYIAGIGGESSTQYIGNHTVWERLFGFQLKFPYISLPYFNYYDQLGVPLEYGIINTTLKTSLFGEWTLGEPGSLIFLLSHILVWVNMAIVLFSMCAMVAVIVKALRQKSKNSIMLLFFAASFVTLAVNQVLFCFNYPNVCTQNFRYVVPTLLTGCLFIGYWLRGRARDEKLGKPLRISITAVACAFCALSAAIYMLLPFSPLA